MLSYATRHAFGDVWLSAFRERVTLDAVREARSVIQRAGLQRTPVINHPLLAEAAGCDLFLKHENHLPTGAFKVRGGLNFMAHFARSAPAGGVITATRGNHGQSIGLAAQKYGIPCVVCVPFGNNPEKNAAMRAYGVELIEHGADFDESREYAEQLCNERGLHYVHSANEPHLINGVGTAWLEVVEDLDRFDAVVVPVGGGSGTCGAITVLRALRPDVEIIGVQAEQAPAVYESWKAGERVQTDSANTIADGLATRVAFELPFSILSQELDDFLLVSEDAIEDAIRLTIRTTHNLIEGAAAAAVAAIMENPDRFAGRRVVADFSGGNLDEATLLKVMSQESQPAEVLPRQGHDA